MIEKVLYDYMVEAMEDICPVYMEEPLEKPSKYVLLEKTGSGYSNKIFTATIAVQSYAESMYEAALLNTQVIDAMHDAVALDELASCRLNTDYNYTDTSTKRYRYQAVFDIVHY